MRNLLRLTAVAVAAVFAAPAVAPAADDLPAVVLFVRPIGSVLEDVRAGAGVLGGPPLIKQFDAMLKDALGEKGLDGLDLTRPVVGYPILKGKSEKLNDTPFVAAVPVTSEEAFLALIARGNKGKAKAEPVAGKAGLYKLPAPDKADKKDGDAKPGEPSVMRFHKGCAYFTQESNAAALDPQTLVPAEQLYLPDETALVAVKVYFARLPEETRRDLVDQIEKGVKELKTGPLPKNLKDQDKELSEEAEKKLRAELARRLEQLKDAREATARVVFDPKSGEAGLEFALGAKPGSGLAQDIAAWPGNTNRFAGLVGADAAAGLVATVPAFTAEIRDLFVKGFEKGFGQAMANSPPPDFLSPLLKELAAGALRTVKAGELDAAVAVAGPDKDGLFTTILGFSFDDATKLDAEVQKLIKEQAPPEIRDLITVAAAKAGGANIHKVKAPDGAAPPEVQRVFGQTPAAAVSFAPKGIYLAVGPDPVAALKAAVVLKPTAARAVDLTVNPARLGKLAAAAGGADAAKQVADILGEKDGAFSALFVTAEGGTELKFRLGVNLKLVAGVAQTWTQRPAAKP